MKVKVSDFKNLVREALTTSQSQFFSQKTPQLDAFIDSWRDSMEKKSESTVDTDNVSRIDWQIMCDRAADALLEKVLEAMDEVEASLEDGQFDDR